MRCNEIRYNLHEYASGKLNELESHATAKHLKSCEKCRRELEDIRAMKELLKLSFQDNVTPPLNLKADIMGSINLKKYKKAYKNALEELKTWGMSLVAAGLILFFFSMGPSDNILQARNDWDGARDGITEKIYHPFSSINERLDKFTERITQLDGITGRLEREKKGGN